MDRRQTRESGAERGAVIPCPISRVNGRECRRNRRLPVALRGELTLSSGESVAVETRNVSLRGLWVDYLPRRADLGRSCTITLFLSDAEPLEAVVFEARIVRIDGEGCGLRLLSMDADDFDLYVERLCRRFRAFSRLLRAECVQGLVPRVQDWRLA